MYIAFALTVGCGHVVVAQVYDQEDGSKSLKLGDFGLAIHYDGQRLLKSVCGTPTYVAPEVIAEEGYVGGHPPPHAPVFYLRKLLWLVSRCVTVGAACFCVAQLRQEG